MNDSFIVFAILALMLAGFIWGRVRYDLVALLALIAAVFTGQVPMDAAFSGFGHPAVITVAAVLVLSRGFQHSGLVDFISGLVLKTGGHVMLQVLVLTGAVALLSGFMNNVGALALLMPVAIRLARDNDTPPSRLLMPLAFGSLLGGLLTLIGTPPNIIISTFRAQELGEGYGMFSFFPVGAGVLVCGLAFLVLAGWRLTPDRKGKASADEMFETADYLSELTVPEDSKAAGLTLDELGEVCEERVPVVAVLRGEDRVPGYRFRDRLKPGDVLLVEAEPEELKVLEEKGGLTLGEESHFDKKLAEVEDLQIVEAVIRADSRLIGKTLGQLRLPYFHNLQVLAVAREGGRLKKRLKDIRLKVGDVLLLQVGESVLPEKLPDLGCLPLASRNLNLGRPRRLLLSVLIFMAAIAAMVAGWLSAPVALTTAAVVSLLSGVLPLREAYTGIDWPIIVLLGALIPVGQALEASGGAQLVADGLLGLGANWPVVAVLVVLFVFTMLLSDIINNAAAALLMAPIALKLAAGFDVSPDPFLMAIAVSASCAFLTPIGHQSNALVMGPGGYRFGDYLRCGLPLSFVVMFSAIPLILLVWPM